MLKRFTGYKRLLALSALSGGAAPVERTATGNPVTFETDLARPLKSLIANFLPIQSGTGDPSPTNIRPITGWTGLDVWHTEMNILDTEKRHLENSILYLGFDDAGYNLFLKAGTYRLTVEYAEGKSSSAYIRKDGDNANTIWTNGEGSTGTITLSKDGFYRVYLYRSGLASSDVVSFSFSFGSETVQIKEGAPTTLPVTWTTHGTIYGGYVDLMTGEVWGTWQAYTFTGEENMSVGSYSGTGGVRINSSALDSLAPKYGTGMSNKAVKEASVPSQISRLGFRIGSGSSLLAFFVPDTLIEGEITATKFKGWLAENSLMICVELESPVLITTLTPTQITALIGNNTVWSDANGDCEIKFLKKG